jgi:hypothetical protein
MPSKSRQTLLTKKKRRLFLDALADGMSVTSAAAVAGFSRVYAYNLKDMFPDFNAEWDDAVQQAADKFEDAVRQRALGAMEAIVYKGEVTGHVERRSDILAMFYLKAKRPEFKDNNKVEINTGDRLSELLEAVTGKDEPAAPDEPEGPVTENGG